jgi:mitotic spindle assembly checkpoint protein MAD1
MSNLQETVTDLTAANTSLDAEVTELMRRVWSGEFNPERERCLELKANPAAKIHAVRTEQLDNLKAENAALLDRLADMDKEPSSSGSADARGLVPRISYDRLQKEKTDLEAAHEKRLRRLKEIFGAKSREFLESVYSLLGWRIRFDENGADIRLTSMYAPKGKMGLTLKFTSNEGHFGTMAMMGGMARSLEEARDFWVTERQSIPGFLAQVTTEMFEKTTLGRAAGYVGLE